VQSGRSFPIFLRNILPPSSRSKIKSSKQEAVPLCCLLDILFDLKNGETKFLLKLSKLLPDYTASHQSQKNYKQKQLHLHYIRVSQSMNTNSPSSAFAAASPLRAYPTPTRCHVYSPSVTAVGRE
jgi:hypothetical protein